MRPRSSGPIVCAPKFRADFYVCLFSMVVDIVVINIVFAIFVINFILSSIVSVIVVIVCVSRLSFYLCHVISFCHRLRCLHR